jgi:hypothetical protein
MSGTPSSSSGNIVNNLTGPAPNGLAFKGTGTFVANGASSVTVANTAYTSGDMVLFALNTIGGTVGAIPTVKTMTTGTGFTVACTASDTSTYTYVFFTPAAQV